MVGVEGPWGRAGGEGGDGVRSRVVKPRQFSGLDPDDSVESGGAMEGHDENCFLERLLWLRISRWGSCGTTDREAQRLSE